jgi:L-arabinose transport system substrate-binding protein
VRTSPGDFTWRGLARRAWAPAAVCVLMLAGCAKSNQIKIGFLVKQPTEPWFQTEWKFAQKAADENHFQLIKIAATDGGKVLTAIDDLNAMGARGFVICTPDPRLGPAIVAKAKGYGMKFMTVDDQLVDGDGNIMHNVHHLGMSPHDIGHQAGEIELAEMRRRGWKMADTGVCVCTYNELDTAKQRTDGAQEALRAGGVPQDRFFDAPNKTTDLPGSFDAADICLTQHPRIKHWLIVGMNDNAVLGAVRATESHGFKAADVIGVGINGTDCHAELAKPQPTGFFGSLLLSPNQHGYQTALMVYRWVKDGVEPPKLTLIRKATFIDRQNWRQALAAKGMSP